MFKPFTRVVRKAMNAFGYEIIKLQHANSFELGKWIAEVDIKTIIDVGSNEGQFIKSINKLLPGRKIIAFEPIKNCFDILKANTKGLNVTYHNCGLSNYNGTTEINVSENLVSSSILPMEDLHKNLYPQSKYISKQTIELKRLDDVIQKADLEGNVLLKIDVQGYEDKVIEGGKDTIQKVSVVIIEFSYEPVYEGQWLFDQTYRYFTDNGFKYAGVVDQARSSRNGIPIYGDAIFVKSDKLKGVY
jgi:FkbM family methyltransferase